MLACVETKCINFCVVLQGGRGHGTVFYTSPQSFMITFSYSLAYKFGDFY